MQPPDITCQILNLDLNIAPRYLIWLWIQDLSQKDRIWRGYLSIHSICIS